MPESDWHKPPESIGQNSLNASIHDGARFATPVTPIWREDDADPELFVARTQKNQKRRIHLNSLFAYRQEPSERTNVSFGSKSTARLP
jgi:hypothetical protein